MARRYIWERIAVLRADGRDFVYLGLMFIQLDFRSYDSGIPYDVLFFWL